jgi:hypothetical protein
VGETEDGRFIHYACLSGQVPLLQSPLKSGYGRDNSIQRQTIFMVMKQLRHFGIVSRNHKQKEHQKGIVMDCGTQ